jgi:hypothetical protein
MMETILFMGAIVASAVVILMVMAWLGRNS